jgi:hypothetical protein
LPCLNPSFFYGKSVLFALVTGTGNHSYLPEVNFSAIQGFHPQTAFFINLITGNPRGLPCSSGKKIILFPQEYLFSLVLNPDLNPPFWRRDQKHLDHDFSPPPLLPSLPNPPKKARFACQILSVLVNF